MKLINFLEEFVPHNRIIRLYKKIINVGPEKHYDEYELLWSGMEWQCNGNSGDEDYCLKRNIEICPYKNFKVQEIARLDDPAEPTYADVVDLVMVVEYGKEEENEINPNIN